MDITGKIKNIKYKPVIADELKIISIEKFDINSCPAFCILNNGGNSFSISKWVSPKRTRSYPFERVYNTLNFSKKITVIPIVKDEGFDGDRDFLQWDTVSLMSLLDVAYYSSAVKKNSIGKMKIDKQKFDSKFILSKIKEIEQYHSSALHWNLNELNSNLHQVIDKAKIAYKNIEKITKVKLHTIDGVDNFQKKIGKDVSLFMNFSREKAKNAQSREYVTIQPKENLATLTKAKITINNYLGGQYFFTVDEIKLVKDKLCLIEGKHTKNALLPSKSDIKDGLIKMILYSNLSETKINGKKINCESILSLTSTKIKGEVVSSSSNKEKEIFFKKNTFNNSQIIFIQKLFEEATINGFTISIKQVK